MSQVDVEVGMEVDPYLVPKEEFDEAGLLPQGWYNWAFVSMKPTARTNKAGEVYHVIAGKLIASEKAVYSEDGELEEMVDLEVPKTKFNDFGITGDALQTLKSAYKTVTGRAPTGTLNPETGRYEDIDVRLLADQLVGAKAWNVIIHREGKDANAGELFANLGYTFKRQPPAKYVVKKPSKKEE